MKDFQQHINEVVVPKIQQELDLKNTMAVPRVTKIVVNVGIGSRMKSSKDYSDVVDNVASITGQKPSVTFAKKAISNFKLREGMPTGVCTTLRRRKMTDFLNRLINVALPRIRDFQGMNAKAFDGHGNYSIGLKDCSIFPEVNPNDLSHVHGMSITIVTSAEDDEGARTLLKALNFPFKKAPAPVAETTEAPTEEAAAEKAPAEAAA